MKIANEKALETLKSFIESEILPSLGDETRAWIIAFMQLVDVDNFGEVLGVFPQFKQVAAFAKAVGVIKDGEIDIDKIEAAIKPGLHALNGKYVLTMNNPIVPGNVISVVVTPAVWNMFRARLCASKEAA